MEKVATNGSFRSKIRWRKRARALRSSAQLDFPHLRRQGIDSEGFAATKIERCVEKTAAAFACGDQGSLSALHGETGHRFVLRQS